MNASTEASGTDARPPLTRDEAIAEFRALVAQYGLQWTANVPAEAYARMRRVNEVLDTGDRREALGMIRR